MLFLRVVLICFSLFYLLLAAMIHWTRQIKEVLSSQDNFEMSENSGPLEEIEFWKNRCNDLSGISSQLDKPGVKKISHILELAKSSYVAPFTKLSAQIKVCISRSSFQPVSPSLNNSVHCSLSSFTVSRVLHSNTDTTNDLY